MDMRSFDIELANPEREERLRGILDKMDLYVYEADEDTEEGRVRVSVAGKTEMMPSQVEQQIRDMGLGNVSVDKSETRMKEYIPTAKDPSSEGMTPDLRFGDSDYDPELVNDYLRQINSVIDQSVLSSPAEEQASTQRSGSGRPEQKNATYNEYMRYLVNEVKKEGGVSEDEAVEIIDEVVEDLVERDKLPEPPDPEDRMEDIAEWVIAAKTFALSKYVIQIIRDVEMEGGDTSEWLDQNDSSDIEGSKQFSQDDQRYKGELGWGDDDFLESRRRGGRTLNEATPNRLRSPEDIPKAMKGAEYRSVKEVAEMTLQDHNYDPEEAAREWVDVAFDQFDPQFSKKEAHREMVDFFRGVKEGGMTESKKNRVMIEAMEGFSDDVDEREAKKFFTSMAKEIERKVNSARYSIMVQDMEAHLEDRAGYEMDFTVYPQGGEEIHFMIQPDERRGEIGKKQGAIEGPIQWQFATASDTFGREFDGFYSTEGGLIGDATMILDEIEKHVNQSV